MTIDGHFARLLLRGSDVIDSDLTRLSNCKKLVELDLSATKITDAAIWSGRNNRNQTITGPYSRETRPAGLLFKQRLDVLDRTP